MANPKAIPTAPAVPSSQDSHSKSSSTDSGAKSNKWSLSRFKDRVSDKLHVPKSNKTGSRSPSPAPPPTETQNASSPASTPSLPSSTKGLYHASSLPVVAPSPTTNVSIATANASGTLANAMTARVTTSGISGPRTAAAVTCQTSPSVPAPAQRAEIAKMRPRANIFSDNGTRTQIEVPVPEDGLIEDTAQLALCVHLLNSNRHSAAAQSPSSSTESAPCPSVRVRSDQQEWIELIVDNPLEEERLYILMNRMVDKFIQQPTHGPDSIREIVLVGPMLDKDQYRELIMFFLDEFEEGTLLRIDILLGLVQLVQDAPAKFLKQDDLTRILQSVRERLEDPNQKDAEDTAHLTFAISVLLSALVASPIPMTELDREKEHEPLLTTVSELRKHKNPLVKFQAEYTSQILLTVPHNETKRHEFGRHIVGLTGGLLNMSNVITLQFDGVLENIPDVIDGAVGLFTLAKRVFGSNTQDRWFQDVQKAEEYARNGQFSDLNKLICDGPSYTDINSQWRVCQLLGEIAAEPTWDEASRSQALILLEEYFKVNDDSNRHSEIRRWVLTILRHISDLPSTYFPEGTFDSEELSNEGIKGKARDLVRKLKRRSEETLESSYPLRNRLPLPRSSTLLNMVNNDCDLDTLIDRLRRQRCKEHGRRRKYDDRAIYIEPMSKSNLKATDEVKLEPMRERAQLFIEGKAKVLLILGDSGSGKSTFNRHLEYDLWKTYKPRGVIPLFIDLKTIADDRQLVVQHLTSLNLFSPKQIVELRKKRQFILICDGYDECRSRSNLYDNNNLNRLSQWKAKLIVSCRSQYLGLDYRTYFQPHANEIYNNDHSDISDQFEEAVIVPFKQEQIQDYVEQYIASPETQKSKDWTTDRYMDTMKEVPNLADLVTNPFLLRIILDTLPGIVGSSSDLSKIRVSRVRLYDAYVIRHFQVESRRLDAQISQKKMKEGEEAAFEGIRGDFIRDGIHYAKRLAAAIFRELNGVNAIEYVSTADFNCSRWMEEFFSMDAVVKLRRESSPLVRSGNRYRFHHRSILEYFCSCLVFEPRKSPFVQDDSEKDLGYLDLETFLDPVASPSSIASHPFGHLDLVSESSVIHFLVERVLHSVSLKKQLIRIISLSKDEPTVGRAAANAITILIRAGVHFNGTDLREIKIPGADLSEGQFDSVQLQGADLTGVRLKRTWLRQADLTDATMTDARFGEKPFFKVPDFCCTAISSDEKMLAAGGYGGDVQIFGTFDFRPRFNFEGHSGHVGSVAISNDSSLVASGGEDRTVRIWHLKGGEHSVLQGHSGTVCSVAFSPDGRHVASASNDGTARSWNVESGSCTHVLKIFLNFQPVVAWSPCGRQIATGTTALMLWDAKTGELERTLDEGGAASVIYSPKGKLLGGSGTKLTVWDLASDSNGNKPTVMKGISSFQRTAFSQDEQTIAASCSDGSVQLWDWSSGSYITSLTGHSSTVSNMAFLKDRELVSASRNGTIRYWQLDDELEVKGNTFNAVSGSKQSPGSQVNSLVFSPSGLFILSAGNDDWILQWNTETGDCRRFHKVGFGATLVISSNGQQLAVTESWGDFRVYEIGGTDGLKVDDRFSCATSQVAYSPCGQWMATSEGSKGTVRLWDLLSGEDARVLEGDDSSFMQLTFSPNGRQLISLCLSQTIRLWDIESGKCTDDFDLSGYCVLFSPCGNMLAILAEDSIRLWNLHERNDVASLTGFEESAHCIAWSPCGGWIAAGCEDGTVCLWRISKEGADFVVSEVIVIRDFLAPVRCLAWSPTEPWVFATGCDDDSLCVWRIAEVNSGVRVQLVWGSLAPRLTASGTRMDKVDGLTDMQKELLLQRGAIDKSTDSDATQ